MLTREQTASLFAFVEKKRVLYYDVQVELVDHLANAIEAKMAAEVNSSFEEALEQVYKGFGVMGFSAILRDKMAMAERTTRKRFYDLLKQQFGWPKVILVLLLGVGLFGLFLQTDTLVVDAVQITVFVVMILLTWITRVRLDRMGKRAGQKLLLLRHFYTSSLVMLPLYLFNTTHFFERVQGLPEKIGFFYLLLSAVVNSVFVAVGIAYYQTYVSVKQEVYKSYPVLFAE